MRILLVALALTLLASPGTAVLIDSGDGKGNVTPPLFDPGFWNVGRKTRHGRSVVYLGNGWVATAGHVGAGRVRLAGVSYSHVPDSTIEIQNPDSGSADLILFRISGSPELPDLPPLRISRDPPEIGAEVVLVGYGLSRGERVEWAAPLESGQGIRRGWRWNPVIARRWGTNRISENATHVAIDDSVTRAIATDFSPAGAAGTTRHEAQALVGDSGGALFVADEQGYALAGLLFAVSKEAEQPSETSLYGNLTFAADLAYYRSQIVPHVFPKRALAEGIVRGEPTARPDALAAAGATLAPPRSAQRAERSQTLGLAVGLGLTLAVVSIRLELQRRRHARPDA